MTNDPSAGSTELRPAPGGRAVLVLAVWFGLVSGVLDLIMIVVRRDVLHVSPYYEQGRHFLWTVPAANLVLMIGLGLVMVVAGWVRPAWGSVRVSTFLFTTFAVWGPLLRMPLHGLAGLVVGAGVARVSSGWIARHASRFTRFATIGSVVMLVGLAATASVSLWSEAAARSARPRRLAAGSGWPAERPAHRPR